MQRFISFSYRKSVNVNIRVFDHFHRRISTKIRKVVPFSFDENEAVQHMNRWRNSLWLAPTDWKDATVTVNRRFIPCWSITVKGYVTGEAYIQRGSWLMGGTEWEKLPEQVQLDDIQLSDINVYAAHVYDREHMLELNIKTEQSSIELDPTKIDENLVDEWTIDRNTAFEIAWDLTIINKVQDLCIKKLNKQKRGEYQITSIRFPIQKETQEMIYFPIYVTELSYAGRNYQYLINGRTGQVSGQRQFSSSKVTAVLLGVAYPICLSSSVSVLSLIYYLWAKRLIVIPCALLLVGTTLPISTMAALQIGKYVRDYSHLYRGKRDIRDWLDFKKRNAYLFNDRPFESKNHSTFQRQRHTGDSSRDSSFTLNIGPNFYNILEVSRIASELEIKKAYLAKVKEFHPDLNPGRPDIEEKFKLINQAYAVLSDPEQREIFDQYGYDYVKYK